MPDPILKISDIENDVLQNNSSVNFNGFYDEVDPTTTLVTQTIVLQNGWNFFGTYIDAQASAAAGVGTFATGATMTNMLSGIVDDVIIAKDYQGSAYLPEFNFDGIGTIYNGQGYQIKVGNNIQAASDDTFTLTITGIPIVTSYNNQYTGSTQVYGCNVDFPEGWFIFTIPFDINASGNPALGSYDVAVVMDNITNGNVGFIKIIKDFLGSAYLPEYNFNGIGDFKVGQAYQIKSNVSWSSEITGTQ